MWEQRMSTHPTRRTPCSDPTRRAPYSPILHAVLGLGRARQVTPLSASTGQLQSRTKGKQIPLLTVLK
mgnify:CR=1 FL=1|jgi:hypothetical protein